MLLNTRTLLLFFVAACTFFACSTTSFRLVMGSPPNNVKIGFRGWWNPPVKKDDATPSIVNGGEEASSIASSNEQQGATIGPFDAFDINNTSSIPLQQQQQQQPVLMARLIAWVLKRVVLANTQLAKGVKVDVKSASNRQLVRGKVESLELTWDKIAFGQLYVTGGGRLLIEGLDLRMRRFLFFNQQTLRKPYRIAGDFLLTQSDIVNSKFIRNMLQLLVNTILQRVLAQAEGALKLTIKKVTIRERRLYVLGEASVPASSIVGSGASILAASNVGDKEGDLALLSFEVSTGAGVREEGQVIYLKDIQVTLNPDSAVRASLPIVLSSPIDVDLGTKCCLESLVITNSHVWIRAISEITPAISSFSPPPARKRALFFFDLANLLSSVLKLHGGFLSRFVGLAT